jgi:PAP2 (acid phosphatase) superfamily protein
MTTAPKAQGLGRPFPYVLATICCMVLESVPVFDAYLQQLFFQHGAWLISKSFHNSHKLLLYTGPKLFIICTGIAFFMLTLIAFSVPSFKERLYKWRKPALIIIFSLVLIPLTVAILKICSGVYSPVDLLPYGGKHPHVGFLGQLYAYGTLAGGHSFPAGHASGGFALMALYYMPVRKVLKKLLLGFGLMAGWSMGMYQMARGEHFLSHTLTTMFLALAIIAFLGRAIFPEKRSAQ